MDEIFAIPLDLKDAVPAIIVGQGIGITQAPAWFEDDKLSGSHISERVSQQIHLQRMIARPFHLFAVA